MTDQGDLRSPIWRPLTLRGVPVHLVVPAAAAALGLGLLLAGGVAAIVGGWILTVGFPLAVGAFVAAPIGLAAPAALWAGWLVVVAATDPSSGVPQTPPVAVLVLAALSTAAAWLGQRAIGPAVAAPHGQTRSRGPMDAELDALLAAAPDLNASPSLDPRAEVDEALAQLLADGIDETEPLEPANPQAQVDADGSPNGAVGSPADADDSADDTTGHVIEFAALREEDLDPPSGAG